MQQKNLEEIEYRSHCPISSALDIVGDKWSLLIIRDIALSQKNTFSEFAQSEEGIASNILSDRLKRLENLGIIAKGKLPNNMKTNIYTLTEKGADFFPVIVEYILWSNKYLNDHISGEARQFAKILKKEKAAIIEKTKKSLLQE